MRKFSTTFLAALLLASVTLPGLGKDGDISAAPDIPKNDREKTRRAPIVIAQSPDEIKAELKQLKQEVALKPQDAQLRYKLGESYRKNGDIHSAVAEYVKATKVDPNLWVAYHQICAFSDDEKLLDDSIASLSKLEQEKPKEMLLRVALSELYEKRGNYYQAARTLIDLTYANAVPEKYRVKVNARIHNMLVLSKRDKQQQGSNDVPATANGGEEELDIMPAPLPTQGTKRSLAQAKLKDSKEVRGMGHTPLLP
jgi:cytochrome c-type biogenesis protein CcmH/NrfG